MKEKIISLLKTIFISLIITLAFVDIIAIINIFVEWASKSIFGIITTIIISTIATYKIYKKF